MAGAVNISLYEAPCIDGPCALVGSSMLYAFAVLKFSF